jgi:hypothetical protein
MLPNIEESVSSLKRLIADSKDRARALTRLADAEEAHRRHAADIGIPFNAEAFARRRAELDALPKVLTVEEGQLSSFSALQRAIGVILDGPFVREGRGSAGGAKKKVAKKAGAKRGGAKKSPAKARKAASKPAKSAKPVQRSSTRTAPRASSLSSYRRATSASGEGKQSPGVSGNSAPRSPLVKPLPLALGS